MRHVNGKRSFFVLLGIFIGFLFCSGESAADPSKYPQYAQQQLPKGVKPEFIHLDQLVDDIVKGKKPLIIDVRSAEEYQEVHIKVAISIPLDKIPQHLKEIPKDKPVVLY